MKFLTAHPGIAGALIIGGGVLVGSFIVANDISLPNPSVAVASPTSALREQIIEKDSDGDGLLDWEETLWGTDPYKIDTDGDGILDGEYVANRKKDKAPEEIVNFEDLSFTQQFSREFFGMYLEFKADGEVTEVEKNALIAKILNSRDPDLPLPYEASRVKTIPQTEENLRSYFVGIVLMVQGASPKDITKSELVLLEEALQDDAPELLGEVKRIADGYAKLSNELQTLSVPQTVRTHHAEFVTATMRLAHIIEGFSRADSDAAYALVVLPEYQNEVDRMVLALQGINEVVNKSTLIGTEDIVAAQRALGL